MTRDEALEVAAMASDAGHYGIRLVEEYPNMGDAVTVESVNACGMRRTYASMEEATDDLIR